MLDIINVEQHLMMISVKSFSCLLSPFKIETTWETDSEG
jgi:hypothetical protein